MFEWDEAKNVTNIREHGVDFAVAKMIFRGFVFTQIDERFDYDEVREISIGMVGAAFMLAVVHTDREGATRLISARRANRGERKAYETALRKSAYS